MSVIAQIESQGFTLCNSGPKIMEWRKGDIIIGHMIEAGSSYWISYKDEAEPYVKRHKSAATALKRYKH